jgi:hypothetical protein
MWILVYIVLIGEPRMVVFDDPFKTINECFIKRDELLVGLEQYGGKFPKGTGAYCIQKGED